MPTFERFRERKDKKPRSSSQRRSYGGRDSFEDRPKRSYGRPSGRAPMRKSRDSRDFQMTKVICSSCGDECEVPFKPTSDKPVYCDNCFSKNGKSGSDKLSSRNLDAINEKLNKIMKALKIE